MALATVETEMDEVEDGEGRGDLLAVEEETKEADTRLEGVGNAVEVDDGEGARDNEIVSVRCVETVRTGAFVALAAEPLAEAAPAGDSVAKRGDLVPPPPPPPEEAEGCGV